MFSNRLIVSNQHRGDQPIRSILTSQLMSSMVINTGIILVTLLRNFGVSSFYLSQRIYNDITYLYRQNYICVNVICWHTDFAYHSDVCCPVSICFILIFYSRANARAHT
jgi:DMSO/TMAO reductase YedYZ heme-binding membrane subunit